MKLLNKKKLALLLIPIMSLLSIIIIHYTGRILYMFRITDIFITNSDITNLTIIFFHFFIGYKLINKINLLRQTKSIYIVLSFLLYVLLIPIIVYFVKNNSIHSFNYEYSKEITMTIALSIGLFFRNKKGKYYFIISMVVISMFLIFTKNIVLPFSNQYYLYGNYTGKTKNHNKIDKLKLIDSNGNKISIDSSKTIVIDFWNRNCGRCFHKFPLVKKMQRKFQNSNKVLVLAINVYKRKKDIDISEKLLEKTKNKNLINYYLSEKDAEIFKIQFVPKVIVIKDRVIIFEGNIEVLNLLDFMYLK